MEGTDVQVQQLIRYNYLLSGSFCLTAFPPTMRFSPRVLCLLASSAFPGLLSSLYPGLALQACVGVGRFVDSEKERLGGREGRGAEACSFCGVYLV